MRCPDGCQGVDLIRTPGLGAKPSTMYTGEPCIAVNFLFLV
jgi:hypothetical protein